MRDNILTVVVEIKDKAAAEPIWEAMKVKGATFLGCEPFVVSWGDLSRERDQYKAVVDKAMASTYDVDEDEPGEVITKCGKKFYQYPFGVYSTSAQYYEGEEWFASLDDLKEKYDIVPDGE